MESKKSLATDRNGLSSCLRAFLAESRLAQIGIHQWRKLRDLVVSPECLRTCSDQVLLSACSALKKERNAVSNDEWLEFTSLLRRELARKGKTDLLERLGDVTNATAAEVDISINNMSNASKRKRSNDSAYDLVEEGKRSRKEGNEEGKEVSLRSYAEIPAFFLLKSVGVPDHRHSIALDEIVIAGAELALVCNYKFDLPWMWESAPALQTSQKILIVHGESSAEEQEWISFLRTQGAQDRVRFCRPVTPPYGTVHTKMMLFFFTTGCRVCIHTANMVDNDWVCKTQAAYVRDFPTVETDNPSSADPKQIESDFKTQLERYFGHALKGQDQQIVKEALGKYDFSSAGVALVSSVPGTHRDLSRAHFGHARLRSLLHADSFPEESGTSVAIAQFSSLGSTQSKWLDQEFKETLFSSAGKSILGKTSCQIKLVFPTAAQVENSNEGLQAGGSLPVTSKNLERPHILEKLHKWDAKKSGRERAMPHIKTYLRYNSSRPETPLWAFIGSFNLSVAAWGRMGVDQKRKSRKNASWDRIHILSYEMGVLFSPRHWCPPKHFLCGSAKFSIPVSLENMSWDPVDAEKRTILRLCDFSSSVQGLGRNKGSSGHRILLILPIPYAVPPPRYETRDVPWTTSHCTVA